MKKRWLFFLAVMLFALVLASQASAAGGLLTADITSATKSCKIGESIDVTYSRGGLEGDVFSCLRFYAVPGYGETEPCVLLHEEKITPGSSGEYSFTVDASAGEWVLTQMIFFEWTDCLGCGDRFYTKITDGTARTEFSACRLGKSGWVEKDGKWYYGDENGNAVFGEQEIDGKYYYFNSVGEMNTGWFRGDDLNWRYSDEKGVYCSRHMEGVTELEVPSFVDRLNTGDFKGAGRAFYIKCEEGSYAESFALEHGIQYDNGKKKVIGYAIDSVEEKVKWVVENYIRSDMTERQKADVLNWWLQMNAHYDGTFTNYHADGVLLKGYGVCESYAEAYALLLNEAGIESVVVSGHSKYDKPGDPGHAWTMLRVNGQWYHCNVVGEDLRDPSAPVINGEEYIAGLVKDGQFGGFWIWDKTKYSADRNSVGWITCKGETYYYDGSPDGGRHIGWLQLYEDGPWYYFDETGTMVKGREIVIDGEAWYFDSDGKMIDNQGTWVESGGAWYFIDAYGNKAVGWKAILADWYYFDETGRMKTGWLQSGDSLYYFSSDGTMVTGWFSLNGIWHYFGDSGAMVTGWLQDGNDWYYFTDSGKMAAGWQKVGNDWYYFRDSGAMATGWIQSGNDWYYMKSGGAMATGWIKDGAWYYFNSSGRMVTGWVEDGGTWYYFTNSGAMKTGWLQLGSKWYWFDNSGAMVTGWKEIGGQWEMFAENGEWLYTWQGE